MKNSKKEINRRLMDPEFSGSLELAPPPPPPPEPVPVDPIVIARKIVARSKRRVTILTWITCFVWVLATAAGCALAGLYFIGVQPIMSTMEYRFAKANEKVVLMREQEVEKERSYDASNYLNVEEFRDFTRESEGLKGANMMMMILTQGFIVLTGVAALMSVWLITASRRCTMKQINANLAAICDELKSMSAV